MILVQTIITTSLPQSFWKALNTSSSLFDTFRANGAYGIALAKICTDYKDILITIVG